jgi:septal ring factor EnvC (AmiA/AmiB activator)
MEDSGLYLTVRFIGNNKWNHTQETAKNHKTAVTPVSEEWVGHDSREIRELTKEVAMLNETITEQRRTMALLEETLKAEADNAELKAELSRVKSAGKKEDVES